MNWHNAKYYYLRVAIIYPWENAYEPKLHWNIMMPLSRIGASQQATRGRHGDVTRDIKREIHHADGVRREIRVYPSWLLANWKRKAALSIG